MNWTSDYLDLAREIAAEGRSQWAAYVLAAVWWLRLRGYAQAWDATASRERNSKNGR